MSDFPVDKGNLSFSDDECSSLFITQSSFNSISTQDVDDAVDFFGVADMSFGGNDSKITGELSVLSQKSEEMCGCVFDFMSGETDNSWSVDNDCAPFKVTRNADGKQFTVGSNVSGNENIASDGIGNVTEVSDQLEHDMKRFISIVSASELDKSKRKRQFFTFICSLNVTLLR